jgi:hypothetical protein
MTSDFVTAGGELHESIARHFEPAGWTALVSLWQEAAGIQQLKRQPKPSCAPIPAAEPLDKPERPLPPLPANAPLLEKGLLQAISGMPERVAAFLLHTPKDPPVWRYQESERGKSRASSFRKSGCLDRLNRN